MKRTEILEYASQNQYEGLSPKYDPEVIIFPTPEAVDDYAATQVVGQIQTSPRSVLILPTGNTPIGMYQEIVRNYRYGIVDFSQAVTFNLDEYHPIPRSSSDSYVLYMRRNLFDHVNVSAWNIPDGEAPDPKAEADRFQQLLDRFQPVDLAILGIGPGTTCHLGFNEKGSSVDSRIRQVALDPQTVAENSKLFDNPEEIPQAALTLGIADILQAKRIILLAKGSSKAWGINRALKGPVSSEAPASFLRLHPNVTLAVDREAGGYLTHSKNITYK